MKTLHNSQIGDCPITVFVLNCDIDLLCWVVDAVTLIFIDMEILHANAYVELFLFACPDSIGRGEATGESAAGVT